MCGIFGLISSVNFKNKSSLKPVIDDLFRLSESRGKEASGLVAKTSRKITSVKCPFPATDLVKSSEYKRITNAFIDEQSACSGLIGHSRLVTNGYEHDNKNNQPVNKNGMSVVHNGIIVNHNDIWKRYPELKKETELDSELIPAIIGNILDDGKSIQEAITRLYGEIKGMTSIAVMFSDRRGILLATNNGSLYTISNNENTLFCFASEASILKELIKRNPNITFNVNDIKQIESGNWFVVDENMNWITGSLINPEHTYDDLLPKSNSLDIENIEPVFTNKTIKINTSLEHFIAKVPPELLLRVTQCNEKIDSLRRCSKCILPETFPFIEFGLNGICNYCRNHMPPILKGDEALRIEINNLVDRKLKGPHCLIPFSGGRDSSYAMHYAVRELGLKPIAFSYDWGMLTDLARRNQSRMCGILGVEHILVSADIRKKRENIRKNVLAWLKRPRLGTIPLFMAGDKQYFYYNKKIMAEYDLKLSIMGENPLEKTGFKTMFSGARQTNRGFMAYNISSTQKIKMLAYYAKEYLLNPAYLNQSLLDTADAYFSYYGIKHDYLNLFAYLQWDENLVRDTLINEYDWETDPGTPTTWRIGDGTAAFYNYIYYVVAGFTENDTFRSNQIREGQITREEALAKVKLENQPRWDSIQWYCNVIGIDWINTVKIINNVNSLY